jgi:leader peptidase (prepilin peptidase) / N-methyltransferase
VEIPPLVYTLICLLGLVFGSFFNVAIYRWPREDEEHEWVFTPSHCPKCGARIRWYDNIPLVSYLVLLRGKCRDCKAPISLRYPLVELSNALLWVLTAWLVAHHGLALSAPAPANYWHVAFAIAFASLYFLTFIIDMETRLIPDEITVAHFVLACGFLIYSIASGTPAISAGWLASLLGMLGLSIFFFILYRFNAMGGGDVSLALGLGVLFGGKLTVAMCLMAVFTGGVIGLFVILYHIARRQYKPGIEIFFGPFLALAAYICMFYGYQLIAWYLRLFGLGSHSAPA